MHLLNVLPPESLRQHGTPGRGKDLHRDALGLAVDGGRPSRATHAGGWALQQAQATGPLLVTGRPAPQHTQQLWPHRPPQYWVEMDLWFTDTKSTEFRNKDKIIFFTGVGQIHRSGKSKSNFKLIKKQRTPKMHQCPAARSEVTTCCLVAPRHSTFQTLTMQVTSLSRDIEEDVGDLGSHRSQA